MGCFFENNFKDIDVNELRKSAENVLEFTESRAKSTLGMIKEKFGKLDEDKRSMIIVGVSVFAGVLLVAGIFYLLGKRAGRREATDFEYEEWDS